MPIYEDRNDRLTYSLSGRDEDSFKITGSVDYNSVVTTALNAADDPDGRLEFKEEPGLRGPE